MFTRTASAMIVLLWLTAMGWLTIRDIWPAWSADEAPVLQVNDWLKGGGRQSQAGIYDGQGRIGTLWSVFRLDSQSIQREDSIWLDALRLPAGEIGPLRIGVDSTFTGEGLLDEFTIRVVTQVGSLDIHGERFHSDFSFEITTPDQPPQTFKVPLTDAGMISGALNPFSQMTTDLQVGQTWRMQVINPVAALTGVGNRFRTMIVSVSGQESIDTSEGHFLCKVIEAEGAKAWVDELGVVRRQQIQLPVGGTFRIENETYEDHARQFAITRTIGTR